MLAIEAQEVAWWRMRREEVAHPFFVAPHGRADVEHVMRPFWNTIFFQLENSAGCRYSIP
jgi:hypothetical protein